MEIIINFLLWAVKRLEQRHWLATSVKLTKWDGELATPQEILQAEKKAQRQLVLRQIFGILHGGRCTVEFITDDSGKEVAVVKEQ